MTTMLDKFALPAFLKYLSAMISLGFQTFKATWLCFLLHELLQRHAFLGQPSAQLIYKTRCLIRDASLFEHREQFKQQLSRKTGSEVWVQL